MCVHLLVSAALIRILGKKIVNSGYPSFDLPRKINKFLGEPVLSTVQRFVQHGIMNIWLHVHVESSHVQDKSIV